LLAALVGARAAGAAELPFSRDELDHAVAARVSGGVARLDVDVEVTPDGVRVRLRGRERLVSLGEERGAEAARRVAQGIGDLLLEAHAGGLPPSLEVAVAAPPPAPPAARPGRLLAAWPTAGITVDDARAASFGGAVDLDLPLVWRLRLAAQLASSVGEASAALTLRPAIGVRLGRFALRVGPVGSWMRLAEGAGGFLGGAHAAALAYVPLGGRLRAVFELGGDLYANRVDAFTQLAIPELPGTHYQSVIASTPRAVVRGGAGLAWPW
jgi:hypothetical protein